jgi:hypothetical protein
MRERYTQTYRKINTFAVADFLTQLSYENWDEVFGGSNVNLIFNAFLNSYLRKFNSCFPVVQKQKITKSANINWITPGIRVSCERKRNLYLRLKKDGNAALKDFYYKYCKILNEVIAVAKKMAYDNYIRKSHNKFKSTWKIINSETGRIPKHSDLQDLIKKFKNLNAAEQINDYFISFGNKSLITDNGKHSSTSTTEYQLFMQHAISNNYPLIHNEPTTLNEIEKIIKSFKTKDSCGYDQISLRITKFSAPYISSPLSYICNKILQCGVFPERLKYSVVKPIHKKGDKSLANYRPISLLTSFSKIVEITDL